MHFRCVVDYFQFVAPNNDTNNVILVHILMFALSTGIARYSSWGLVCKIVGSAPRKYASFHKVVIFIDSGWVPLTVYCDIHCVSKKTSPTFLAITRESIDGFL